MAELKQQFKENKFSIQYDGELSNGFATQFETISIANNEAIVKAKASDNAVLKYFIDHGLTVRSYHELLPSLNEIFIKAVNEENLSNEKPVAQHL